MTEKPVVPPFARPKDAPADTIWLCDEAGEVLGGSLKYPPAIWQPQQAPCVCGNATERGHGRTDGRPGFSCEQILEMKRDLERWSQPARLLPLWLTGLCRTLLARGELKRSAVVIPTEGGTR